MHGRGCPQGTLRPIPLPDGPPTPCDTIRALLEDYPYYERRHWDTFFGWLKEKGTGQSKGRIIKLATWRGYPPPDPKARYDVHYYDGFPYDYDKLRARLHALSLPEAVALAGMSPVEIEARLGIEPPKAERPTPQPTPDDAPAEAKGKTLADYAIDLSTFAYDGTPEPILLERSDGAAFMYEGKVIWVTAPTGRGKTWLQLYIMAEQLQMGRRVAFCDWEGRSKTIYGRLLDIGIDPTNYPGQIMRVAGGFENEPDVMAALCDWLIGGENGPASVHIESVTKSGADPNGGDLLPWWTKLIEPLKETGATMILSDHPKKSPEGRAPGPIGSYFKGMQADQMIDFKDDKKKTNWNKTQDGYQVLVNVKDSHGELPVIEGEPLARFNVTHEGGALTMTITPPEKSDSYNASEMSAAALPVLMAMREADGGEIKGYAVLLALAKGSKDKQNEVIKWMKDEGLIDQSAKGKGKTRYWVSNEGEDYLEAHHPETA